MEVVVEQLRVVGQHRQGRVGSHRADGFNAVAGHGYQQHFQVFERITKGLLALQNRGVAGLGQVLRVGQRGQLDQVLVKPLTVGLFNGDLFLDLGIIHDPAQGRVDVEHAAGLETAFMGDVLRSDIEHADL